MDEHQIISIQQELKDYLEANKEIASNRTVGRSIGYSAAYVSQFINGKFPTPNKLPEFAEKIQKFLEDEKTNNINTSTELQFVKIQAYREFNKIATHARRRKKMDLITGDPGTGKTVAAKMYSAKHSGVYHIECTPLITPRGFLKRLCIELKLKHEGALDDLFMSVVERLKGTNILLILDEAENLPTKGLEVARRIKDLSEIGMVLCGTIELKHNLSGRKKDFAQLYSRITIAHEISALSPEDAQEIIAVNIPYLTKKWRIIYGYSKENARNLGNLIDNIQTIKEAKNGNEITDEDIADAAAMLITKANR